MGTCKHDPDSFSAAVVVLVTGGASRDRTGDLYNAIVALSQLSYGPTAGKTSMIESGCGGRQASGETFAVAACGSVGNATTGAAAGGKERPDAARVRLWADLTVD